MASELKIYRGDKVRHTQTGQTGTAAADATSGKVEIAMDCGIRVLQSVHDLEKAA